jgi:multidrug efflux pump subunit AcrA (membrane-fusion protein)
VANIKGPLKAGMTAYASVKAEMTAPVLAVPTSAVFERDGRKYVYVIDQDHVLLTEVTIGMQNTEFTAVNSGISAGTEVVSSDTVLLMNGDRILRSK